MWYDAFMAHKRDIETPRQYEVRLGARGRIVLPAAVRKRLGLRGGHRLLLVVDPSGEMRMASLQNQVRKFQGMLKSVHPRRILSDELIAERREEALREDRG
jgi:AbrB family looped-hinge helix DNA binding protein